MKETGKAKTKMHPQKDVTGKSTKTNQVSIKIYINGIIDLQLSMAIECEH